MNQVGKRTPTFLRFSTVGGEKGSADAARDPRGFALKFYTEEGNYDMVGNNTPVFFIRDPIKFPDFIHTQKRDPQTNCKSDDMIWDFWSQSPESLHQVTILMSDRGTPDGYRHMNGYSSHTFVWVNQAGQRHYIKYHFKTEQGIKNLTAEQANKKAQEDPDSATRDLFESIQKGQYPAWSVFVQVMPEKEAETYRFDVFDITKVWPHSDYPLVPVGRLVLNRNPENYFAEVEQSAFSPSHLVPGIEPSNDKMLQGRLFSYPDTHRHRLGTNYDQIPVNCPYRARISHNQKDGFMVVNGNGGSAPNYEPNTRSGAVEDKTKAWSKQNVAGTTGRFAYPHPNDDFEQPRALFRKVMNETDREHLVQNIAGSLKNARKEVQERQILLFTKVDPEYGERVAKAISA